MKIRIQFLFVQSTFYSDGNKHGCMIEGKYDIVEGYLNAAKLSIISIFHFMFELQSQNEKKSVLELNVTDFYPILPARQQQ